MATRASGYAATFIQSRRAQLESARRQAEETISNEEVRFKYEQKLYQSTISRLDAQVLEYDKLLNAARTRQSELGSPRTTKVSYGSQRQTMELGQYAATVATYGKEDRAANAALNADFVPPEQFQTALTSAIQAITPQAGTSTSPDLVIAASQRLGQIALGLNPEQQYKALELMQSQLGSLIGAPEDYDSTAYLPGIGGDTEGMKTLRGYVAGGGDFDAVTGERRLSYEEALEAERVKRGFPERAEQMRIVNKAFRVHGGPGMAVSGTKEVLAKGEAERLARAQTPGFRATADALRDDGVISDDERKKLIEDGFTPEDYLDESLMAAIARTGMLTAERASLAGRRATAQQEAAALMAPDSSDQRLRELTAMGYGPAGITPAQALFRPQEAKEKVTAERDRLTAKQAMLQGVMQAASGESPDLDDEQGVYASQLTDAINSGNTESVKALYGQMREAGYDDSRLQGSFTRASKRASELAQNRRQRDAAAQAEAAQP